MAASSEECRELFLASSRAKAAMEFSRKSASSSVSRRALLHTMGLAGVAAGVNARMARADTTATAQASLDPDYFMKIELTVNGDKHAASIDPRTSLLDFLREHLYLTGTKKGCDHGQCGACTVLLDGKRVLSCLTLAAMAEGREVTTIEGLAQPDGSLHPMQQAFIDNDAFQCGYCTPGQIVSAVACVKEGHAETDAQIREYMSGNLCRCAAYPNIVDAIKQAKPLMKEA
jgi:xanthine dehydrogenase YagT iron-sulfur-binding subunit